MSMTTDERLVALGADGLIAGISGIGPIFLEDDDSTITLPATVISCKLKNEQEGAAGVAREYDLTVEHRYLRRESDVAGREDIIRQIRDALCPLGETAGGSSVSAITVPFKYFRIERETASKDEPGDTAIRSMTFAAFGLLNSGY